MKIVKLKITGVGSLLMHNPASMRSQASETLQRGGKKIPLPYDEAKGGLYVLPNKDRQLFLKSDMFRESALIAASDVKDPSRKGRATMTRRFAASVFLCSEHCPLYRANGGGNKSMPITDADDDWEIDTRRVVVQKNGILRSRPKITGWGCTLEFEFDEDLIDTGVILQIVQSSGKTPGVGDYRVGKKGPFGRYTAELDFMSKTVKLALADLVFDDTLYPRTNPDPQYIVELARAMEGGSNMPPIIVCRKTKKIIDGAHRYNAALRKGEKTIAVELRDYKDDAERYADAVMLNKAHGKRLGTDDTLKVIARAEDLGFKEIDISRMLGTSLDHVRALKPRYAMLDRTYAEGGGKLQKIPLKGSVRHLAGENITEQQFGAMQSAPGNSYLFIARQLRDAIVNDLLPPVDRHPALWNDLASLRDLLADVLAKQAA